MKYEIKDGTTMSIDTHALADADDIIVSLDLDLSVDVFKKIKICLQDSSSSVFKS